MNIRKHVMLSIQENESGIPFPLLLKTIVYLVTFFYILCTFLVY